MGLGDSGSASASTVSKEDASHVVPSSEDSSSPECELGLSLSLGVRGGGYFKLKGQRAGGPKILTAEDFNSVVSASSPPSSASSSSSAHNNRANCGIAGTKRAADSVSPSNAASQVVGWPPIRAYRMNNLVNPGKPPLNKAFVLTNEKRNGTDAASEKGNDGRNHEESNPKQRVCLKKSLFVKVNMDGVAIGRKVDVSAHSCYQTLAQTLETMFTAVPSGNVNAAKHQTSIRTTRASKLLDGSSGYILTYEDKDGDWMLVGDVPWRMFLDTVKRLRIMRSDEANGNSI